MNGSGEESNVCNEIRVYRWLDVETTHVLVKLFAKWKIYACRLLPLRIGNLYLTDIDHRNVWLPYSAAPVPKHIDNIKTQMAAAGISE